MDHSTKSVPTAICNALKINSKLLYFFPPLFQALHVMIHIEPFYVYLVKLLYHIAF